MYMYMGIKGIIFPFIPEQYQLVQEFGLNR